MKENDCEDSDYNGNWVNKDSLVNISSNSPYYCEDWKSFI